MNYKMKELLEAVVIGMCIFACILVWGCLISGCRADRRLEQFAPRHGSQASLKGYSYSVESSVPLKRTPTRGASLWAAQTVSDSAGGVGGSMAIEKRGADYSRCRPFTLSEGREPIPKTAGFPIPSSFSTLV